MNFINLIRDKWQARSSQEQTILMLGGIFIAMVLIYFFLVLPLQDKVTAAQSEFQNNRALLAWMQPRITLLHNQPSSNYQPVAAKNLLVTVDTSLKQTHFGNTVTEITQASNNSVQINFSAVPYDDLLNWLAQQQQDGITVMRLSAKPLATIGLANVILVLQTTS